MAPYEILANRLISFEWMQRLRRFAKYWDTVSNSGNFKTSTPLIWGTGSPFQGFLKFSDWLYEQSGRTDGIALPRLLQFLFTYLTAESRHSPDLAAQHLLQDYHRTGHSDVPPCLRDFVTVNGPTRSGKVELRALPKRQARHSG